MKRDLHLQAGLFLVNVYSSNVNRVVIADQTGQYLTMQRSVSARPRSCQ